jgi:hypothetical protein
MTKEKILVELKEKGLTDIIEMIEDAEKGDLEELELVESIGLVHDKSLNQAVISLLEDLGVQMIYVTFDDEEEEDDE